MSMLINPFRVAAGSSRVSFGANLAAITNATIIAYIGELDSNQQTNDSGFNVAVDQVDLLETITSNGSAQFRCGLYTDNAGVPDALLGMSDVKTGISSGTNTMTFSTPVNITSGQVFWLAWVSPSLSIQGGISIANALRWKGNPSGGTNMPSSYGSSGTFTGFAKCRIWGNTY